MTIAATAPTTSVTQLDAAGTAAMFDGMVEQARREAQQPGMAQVTRAVLDKLDGFVERTRLFEQRAEQTPIAPTTPLSPSTANAKPGDGQVGRALESLRAMFDRSIETQLVVRAATQVSGAANTLVRGQ